VKVRFEVPFAIDGIHATKFVGAGLLVDNKLGLIVVDRNTVSIGVRLAARRAGLRPTGARQAGDITITFASSVELPGELVYIHPIHNFAVIRWAQRAEASHPAPCLTDSRFRPRADTTPPR
jgi:hypothetical protein